jgi:hypothetical protein
MYRINIYAQTPGYVPNIPDNAATTGKLTCGDTIVAHTKVDGGNTYVAELEIHGGEITATSGNNAGIGGGDGGEQCGKVTIYGGKISATGGNGAGIGNSRGQSGGSEVIIYGGVVEAKGGNGGNAIGNDEDSDSLTIRGNAVVIADGWCPGGFFGSPHTGAEFARGVLSATGGLLFSKGNGGYNTGILLDNVTLESNITIPSGWTGLHMAGNGTGGKTLNLAGHTITIKSNNFGFHQGNNSPHGIVGYGTLILPPGGIYGYLDVDPVNLQVFHSP